jgi:hypothetical protein
MKVLDFNQQELSTSTSKGIFEPNIYDHCYTLLEENSEFKESKTNFKFTQDFYQTSEMDFLENVHKKFNEIKIYDYNYIDEVNEKLKKNLKQLLGNEYSSESLKPFIKFTTDKILKFATLDKSVGNKIINPWRPIKAILDKGLIIYGTDNKIELLDYNKRFKKENFKSHNNIGFIVKGKPKSYGGLVVDERFNYMISMVKFLDKNTSSHTNPIPLRILTEFISEKTQYTWSESDVQISLTTPMKKMGLLGSTKDGFFRLNTIEDIQESFCFHLGKSASINRILYTYTEILKSKAPSLDPKEYCENKYKNFESLEE